MVSDEKLLEEIRRLASNGNPPTRRQMSEDGKWHGNTVVHRFGTWNDAVRAAGFEVNNKPVPDEKLLEEIRRLASNETPPRQTDMDEDGGWSANTVINRFGTWNNAVREAGFEANLVDEYSKKELLQAIRGCSDGDQAPTKRRFDKTAGPTSETVKDNFGSW